MKLTKSLIFGSAASLIALGGAQAADLPVKAKPVEYVKICSLYGAGFFYIPGTDTCIKIGGYLRADLTVNGANAGVAFAGADQSFHGRYANNFNDYSRFALAVDTRTATEYGVVRTFGQADFSFATQGPSINFSGSANVFAAVGSSAFSNSAGAGVLGLEYAFIQFAGFTFGKSSSAYNTPWHSFPGNSTAQLLGGYDTITGVNNVQYTTQFGNGVSASIGLDDSGAGGYNRSQIINALAPGFATVNNTGVLALYGSPSGYLTAQGTAYSGELMPDVVGNIRVDQAWGLFQLSGAIHDVSPGYWNSANSFGTLFATAAQPNTGLQATGHPDSKIGGAISAALQIKNLPTGAGDDIKFEGTWSKGATKYVLGSASGLPGSYYLFSGGPAGTIGKVAIGAISDGVYSGPVGPNAMGVQLTQGWGFRGAFNHNWDPHWSSSLFGSASGLSYNASAKAAWCGTLIAVAVAAQGPGFSCDPGFSVYQIGTVTRWTPVANLTFSGEVMYSYLKTNMAGQVAGNVSSTWPVQNAGFYQYGSQGTVTAEFRVQRNF